MFEKRQKVLRVLHLFRFLGTAHISFFFLTQQFPQRVKVQTLIVDKRARGDCEERAFFLIEMYANKAGWKMV